MLPIHRSYTSSLETASAINEASASNSYGGIQRSKQEILNNYNIQQNNIENTGGLDLNNLTSDQQGGINLNNLTIGEQQGGIKTIVQTSKKVEYNKIGNGTQQTTTTTTTTIKKKMNLNKIRKKYLLKQKHKFSQIKLI